MTRDPTEENTLDEVVAGRWRQNIGFWVPPKQPTVRPIRGIRRLARGRVRVCMSLPDGLCETLGVCCLPWLAKMDCERGKTGAGRAATSGRLCTWTSGRWCLRCREE